MRLEDIVWSTPPPVRVDESLVFRTDSIAVPGDVLTSDSLIIRKSVHTYSDSCRLDVAHFHAPKNTYRQLGMLIMAGILSSRQPELTVQLVHEQTELRTIRFGWDRKVLDDSVVGYVAHPVAFGYYPEVPSKRHPLYDECLCLRDLPSAVITNDEEMCVTESQYANRRVLSGFGKPEGAVRFAELLLNIGLPETVLDEFHLEGFPGFRSVSARSAEIVLWLPGSIAWDTSTLH